MTEEAAEETTPEEIVTEDTTAYDDSMSVAELKSIAKEKGIAGYSTMNKAKLLEVLNDGN